MLHTPHWGSALRRPAPEVTARAPEWVLDDAPARHFKRSFRVHRGGKLVEERIVPFPSAPIYGINRKAGYTPEPPNLLTLRVIRRPGRRAVRRLFVFHNGLNEVDNLRFYYRLADWIFTEHAASGQDGAAACVVAPFGGHLMQAPFHGPFSQTPLSNYLSDSGELFRQFLRYMVQMRWLLSALMLPVEDWRVGWDLIDAPPEQLADALADEWRALADASETLLRTLAPKPSAQTPPARPPSRRALIGAEVGAKAVGTAVAVLRSALHRNDISEALATHVVGYSLGGFLAQSVFFAWPQLISSCTTICSGGAIRAVAPTAFADPEEWQAVLHSLRAELEDAMLHRRIVREPAAKTVAGMRTPQFGYFKRVFDQVFLQEDQGSYGQRLSEYSARMLFMSGGEDPIVRPQNVLDASPREGINMLSIANLTHFLAREPNDKRPEEAAQREFWLPEVGRLIARAAMRAEQLVAAEVATAGEARESTKATMPARPRGPALSSPEFDDALDWVLDATTDSDGWLIVARNTLPAALLEQEQFDAWGAALHHHDARIQAYAKRLRGRAQALHDRRDRVTLLVPDTLERSFVDAGALFDPQSDTPRGRIMERSARLELWRRFEQQWRGCMRELVPGRLVEELPGSQLRDEGLTAALSAWQQVDDCHLHVTHLPDVWIALDSTTGFFQGMSRMTAEQHLVAWITSLVRELRPGSTKLPRDGSRKGPGAALQRQLDAGGVRMVAVSDAEFNPRYRGRIVTARGPATQLLARSAAGMVRSMPRACAAAGSGV